MRFLTALLAISSVVTASPAIPQSVFCKYITNLITAAHEQAPATAFCSSFLSIPRSTITQTSTKTTATSTITATITTGTITATAPVVTVIVSASKISLSTTTLTSTKTTFTGTTTVTITSASTICVAPTLQTSATVKRDAISKPSFISPYLVESRPLVTSACKCLSIKPATVTSTSIKSVIATTTTTKQVVVTMTTTPLTTSTRTSTILSIISTTTTHTNSVLSTVTATPSRSHSPFQIYVSGGDHDGQYFTVDEEADPVRIATFNYDSDTASFLRGANNTVSIASGNNVGKILSSNPGLNVDKPDLVYGYASADIAAAGATPLSCTLAVTPSGTCPLTCVGAGGSTNDYDCQIWWRIGNTDDGCFAFQPYAVGTF